MSSENDWPASAKAQALRENRAGRLMVACFTVTLALVAIVLCLVYTTTHAAADAEMRVEQTRDVAAALNDTTDDFNAADQANGHYLLTGAAPYRVARNADIDAVNHRLQLLKNLLPDDSLQRERLVSVEPLLADFFARLRTTRADNAPPIAETESLNDEISSRLAEMRREESTLLAQQYTALQHTIHAQTGQFLGLLALSTLALCASYALTADYFRQRRAQAEKARTEACHRNEENYNPQNASAVRALCDIRSALTAILGYCDLPQESATPSEERLDSIRRQAHQIVAAVNDALNIPSDEVLLAPPAPPAVADVSATDALPSNAEAPAASSTAMFTAPTFNGRVLLAEDNPDLQQVIKFYLTEIGADVTIVADGQLACEQALLSWKEEKPFDLILMDVQMPKSDGRAATILLRDAGYTNPIVALTANATEQERGRCFAAGCNGFLTKPVDQDEFHRTMRRYLQSNDPSPALPITRDPDASSDAQFIALRESFESEIPSRIVEIGSAIVSGDFPRVSDLSHQLKGTAGCFGLSAIYDAATALQSAAELPAPREKIERCFQTLTERCPKSPAAQAA